MYIPPCKAYSHNYWISFCVRMWNHMHPLYSSHRHAVPGISHKRMSNGRDVSSKFTGNLKSPEAASTKEAPRRPAAENRDQTEPADSERI